MLIISKVFYNYYLVELNQNNSKILFFTNLQGVIFFYYKNEFRPFLYFILYFKQFCNRNELRKRLMDRDLRKYTVQREKNFAINSLIWRIITNDSTALVPSAYYHTVCKYCSNSSFSNNRIKGIDTCSKTCNLMQLLEHQ